MNTSKTTLRRLSASVVAILAAGALFLCATAAQAATGSPNWSIESLAAPTDFTTASNAVSGEGGEGCESSAGLSEQKCDIYYVTATDVGAAAMKAKNVVLEDTLPAGLGVRHISFYWAGIEKASGQQHDGQENLNTQENLKATGSGCTVALPLVKCTLTAAFFSKLARTIHPDDSLIMEIAVSIDEPVSPGPLTNTVKIEGGSAPSAEASATNTLEEGDPLHGPAVFTAPALSADGNPATQASSHPYELASRIGLRSNVREESAARIVTSPVGDPHDVLVDLPPGLSGSGVSTPLRCTLSQLATIRPEEAAGGFHVSNCPPESQIGFLHSYPFGGDNVISALFNMIPEFGYAAEFGYMDALGGTHVLYITLVPGPQGYVLRTSAREIPQSLIEQIVTYVYGDPATRDGSATEHHVPTLTMPSDCSGQPLITHVHMDSWKHPGTYNPDGSPNFSDPTWASTTSEAPPVSGCNQLAGLFNPTLTAKPETNRGDSPTGLDVDIEVPQSEDFETLATPPLKKAVVTLPEGMTVNPSSANGLQGCGLAQIGVSPSGEPNAAAPHCPDASKIGTVEVETPDLPEPLEGQIYVAKQTENPFKGLLALYIVVNDPKTGVIVKIPAEIKADRNTGQLSTVVDNNPQFPFTELRTHFFGGQRAALRTPGVCGTYKVTSTLTPWSAPESGPPATPSGSFKITQGCSQSAAAEPNKPAFSAGTLTPLAGSYSPFVLRLAREDGSQELKGLNVALPPGLVGKLAGLSECPEAQLAAAMARNHEGQGAAELTSPSCPASSEVGTVTVGAGAGLTPYYAQGKAYLAGPYKGAPLSLAIITPAVAGPYDLGTVMVRTALQVNSETVQISAASDEIPHILQGIPLDVRSIALNLSRNQFTLNPTSCEKMAITGSATSVLNQAAPLSNPFQVGECKKLDFPPKLQISLKGSTKRGGTPALKAILTYPSKGAYANVAKASVALPRSEFLDNAHIKTVCTRVQLAANACPPGSIYGHASASSPLLDKPLEGPVYLGTGYGHTLPDLLADLNGQIHVILNGTIDAFNGGIRNRFEVVPDAPVSKFTLEMQGGGKGLLENHEDLCAKTHRATAKFTAQNGKVDNYNPVVTNSCKGAKAKGKKKHRHGAH